MVSYLVSTQPQLRHSGIESEPLISAISFYNATTSNRIGFRGSEAAAFLEARNIAIPTQPNQAVPISQCLWLLRLSQTEFWILDTKSQHTEFIIELEKAALAHAHVTRLYCQHSTAVFVLTGADCPNMFAKVCAVDLRAKAFPAGRIAQTSVARVSSVVVNVSKSDLEQTRFLILSDISSADYLWRALDDAAMEFRE
ncbi:hypothetical protein LRP49_24325 [Enterovibrio sp. ZSDZ35]|uniref:Sarcosine oxidase subunit gamma n=1 Tax=Enterovibrio qingdaonensis TaxID=2899818 RepID=A0ABT5QUB4_9GAMM|nr:hypothetical protein [Enterovibrio sp. ZSDZ35]MDD1784308.1 hypothetical protein [Enterovibrio sp. ZSDZ35]